MMECTDADDFSELIIFMSELSIVDKILSDRWKKKIVLSFILPHVIANMTFFLQNAKEDI